MVMHSAAEREDHALYVGGQWQRTGELLSVHSPYDGSLVGKTYFAGDGQWEAAISAAVTAFGQTRRLSNFQRAGILLRIAAGIAAEKADLARLIALEAGK